MNEQVLHIPDKSLVVLIGTSGAGKSTFAATHFAPSQVLSSDRCRGMVSDDEGDQSATQDAFAVLNFIVEKRLKRGLVTVIDATNVQPRARRPLVALARKYHVLPVAIVLDIPERICRDRNDGRSNRNFGGHVISNQRRDMMRSLKKLQREGFRVVHTLSSPEEVAAVRIEQRPLWSDYRHETGPFDIIGDVHGCCDELELLLDKLGYDSSEVPGETASQYRKLWRHPEGRKALFVGDLVDRGPRSLDAFDLMRNMVEHGTGLCVPGNHEFKLEKKLRGKRVKLRHGLELTVAELEALPDDVRERYERGMAEFIRGLVSHMVLDDGALVVAHAGLKEEMHGRASGKVKSFALFGDTTGEVDELGLPIRLDWAADYKGEATVVYGHTPVPRAEWLNRTINIDTGCVFGGKLTALRYPERELVAVEALELYAEPMRPLEENARGGGLSAQHESEHLLDLEDVSGKLFISTTLASGMTIREGHSAAALETISRFAVHPQWLIHLPPTMSPTHTSERAGYLESPEEAFAYYLDSGVNKVVCEEKHMGSRAIVVVCRDEQAVRERFGLVDDGIGTVYTRTGRPFFKDTAQERGLLERVHATLTRTGFWVAFDTDWVCLDTELMPWSVKAQALLEQQYAPVGAAGAASLQAATEAMQKAGARGVDLGGLVERTRRRAAMVDGYRDAYRQYCWQVQSLDDLKFAPFHVLATEGKTYFDKTHVWHMETIAKYLDTANAPSMHPTRYRVVDLGDAAQVRDAIAWWDTMTGAGGEGMVVKPLEYLSRDERGRMVQPALKCRGREYLRIIYGPEYTTPAYLERLRKRSVKKKRSLAFREFALGHEALERFVQREPLRRVHECVFGVLALESEAVDPRL
ncbi:polynucleotide kinase-phosphatase [Bradymonas sediminis]|uniref:Polynucleotide kinase-phosphatase n=1 Tax=Bradymonas sediminis TaxID=1548548 RepID=A0A2Z4FJ12_9DELT|nr:polynucleotide kinase-phosphatase [Bradymonas sediminis]AWV88714.1 polynucleotide kinase-phosphatase [Bradymonas sediminis]TDP63594.1 polynucleotide 3'-phosphatase /polynucleotide 5'-hydroxyl-kinase /polynucleotide 2',3'-cyclic phosphate phosphodiesterase [Bradymonas sediminis]